MALQHPTKESPPTTTSQNPRLHQQIVKQDNPNYLQASRL